jgi:hypothetical protein
MAEMTEAEKKAALVAEYNRIGREAFIKKWGLAAANAIKPN